MKVLVADDDSLLLELLRGLLETVGHECITVTDGEAAWDHLVSQGADIVISDWLMPGLNGVQLCERVRAHPDIEYPYFILLTSRGDHNDVLTAVRAGVDEHLAKPLDLDVLEARLIVAERVRTLHRDMNRTRRDLEMANRRLDEAAHRDALTGLGNRLKLTIDLPGIHSRFEREGYVYNIALFDIDRFKEYNDTHGHQKGDALLAQVGEVFLNQLRQGDLIYRYGGEEFLLVLPNRTIEEAARGADRFRRLVAEATAGPHLPASATLSAGVARVLPGESVENVIDRADKALYQAKRGGRNQVVVDSSAVPG
ncbi:MAG TPA: diguanylate cyclase [Actinomycetota bacterium]|nr:diguanylate cyclase [Actinomycetota bacterium]